MCIRDSDVTGNWRVATIAENIEMQDYALDYYKEYFESDDEIHAIVNFNYKTTTKISVIGNLLDVSVYEYVDKEEPVSYTHLDVYKRQIHYRQGFKGTNNWYPTTPNLKMCKTQK